MRELRSWEAPAWAARQKTGSPNRKVVLSVLAAHADTYGRCWPSQRLIADEAEMSERQVRTRLKELAGQGLIAREERRDAKGHRKSDVYVLLVDDPVPTGPSDEGGVELPDDPETLPANCAGRGETQPAKSASQPAAEGTPNRQLRAGRYEPSKELSNLNVGTHALRNRFDDAWQAYEHPKAGDPIEPARAAWEQAVANGTDEGRMLAAARTQGEFVRAEPTERPCQMGKWLSERRYEGVSSYHDPNEPPATAVQRGTIDPGHAKAWATFCAAVVGRHSEAYARSWLDQCGFDGSTILAPTRFVRDRISHELGDLIAVRKWRIVAKPKTRGRVNSLEIQGA